MGSDTAFLSIPAPLRLDLVAKKEITHGFDGAWWSYCKGEPEHTGVRAKLNGRNLIRTDGRVGRHIHDRHLGACASQSLPSIMAL